MSELEKQKVHLTEDTANFNLSGISGNMDAYRDISNGRGDLGPIDDQPDVDYRDKLAYARLLTPEDRVNRIPAPIEQKRTIGQRVLSFFGIKKNN